MKNWRNWRIRVENVQTSMHFTWLLYFYSSFQSFKSIRKKSQTYKTYIKRQTDVWPFARSKKVGKLFIFETKHRDQISLNASLKLWLWNSSPNRIVELLPKASKCFQNAWRKCKCRRQLILKNWSTYADILMMLKMLSKMRLLLVK